MTWSNLGSFSCGCQEWVRWGWPRNKVKERVSKTRRTEVFARTKGSSVDIEAGKGSRGHYQAFILVLRT